MTSPGEPSAITTKTLRDDDTYASSISIYDGMLQPRQTQSTADGDSNSGRIISDTFYDSHGWPTASFAPYFEPDNFPSTTLYAANENQIPSETTTAYDGQGRPTTSTLWHQATQQWHTTTSYPGADETDTTAPAGGRSAATYTNALGQTTSSVVKNTGSTVILNGGAVIPSGTSLTSDSVRLTMQADGNLVLSALATGKSIWSSGTGGNPGAYAKFGTDGNLVIYTTVGTAKWTTGLPATAGSTVRVRNDSTVAVVASDSSTVLWRQGTVNAIPAANVTTKYTYTPAGQVDSIKDSAGNTWSYSYNLLGEKTSQTDPNSGTTSYDKYDVVGNLLQTTDPRGQVLSYAYDWDNRRTAEYNSAWSATPDPAKELASWQYDTLEKGYPTSSTRYVGGASGAAYTQAVAGYNTAYQPTGSTLTVPASDGFAAAGQSAAPSSGTVTYTSTARYTPGVGLLSTVHFQADGNLPAEDVDYGYTQQGNLDGIGGFITSANTPAYVDTTVHDPFGRVLQTNYGPTGKELATFAQYDATTGRVTQKSSLLQTTTTPLDVANYRYNQAGEITAIDDLQNNTTHDTQCFTNDSFQRLTAAWTDTAGITSSTSAPVGAVGGCNTTAVQTTTAAPVTTTTVGGPAPYWQTYTYDLLGDRTGMVDHDTTGNALNNTTQATAYTGADGTTSATLPNQAGTTTISNPTTGTATWTPSYTDTSYTPNKNAGNTMSRKASTTGPIASTFTLTGGGKLCVDDANSATTPGNKVQVYTCNNGTSQKWTIGTDGTVQVLGMCLDTTGNATTSGTLVVIDTCSSDATQKWVTTTAGKLANKANSSVCLTDPGASATKGTLLTIATCPSSGQTWSTIATGALPPGQTQSLTYDLEGRTATATNPSGTHNNTSKYLYDADGTLLEQVSSVDGTEKTRILYLFGGTEQITLNVSAKTWTSLRYYRGPDGTTITRSNSGTVTYQVANAQGTATTAIDASTLAVTRRSYDPYGNPRGTKPTTWVAADENHGYLGQPTDATTGLNLLGARNYDPTLGRFLTPDPLFEAGDPNQMGGYTYAGDNPASGSDPTGTISHNPGDGTECSGGWSKCGAGDVSNPDSNGTGNTDTSSGDDTSSPTPSPSPGTPPSPGPYAPAPKTLIVDNPLTNFVVILAKTVFDVGNCTFWITGGGQDHQDSCDVAGGAYSGGIQDGSAVGAVERGAVRDAEGTVEGVGTGARRAAAADAAGAGAKAFDESAASDLAALKRANAQEVAQEAETAAAKPSKPGMGSSGTKPAEKCSFSPGTPVLMAEGKTKPIGKIKAGDKVEAANPKTGKHQGARTVQHVWINYDRDLLNLTIRTKDGHTATLHTTAKHPFWDDTTHAWVAAGKLRQGDTLETASNDHAYVVSTHAIPGAANRWNLTVRQLHTYYVLAGATPILVHNTGCPRTVYRGDTRSPDDIEEAGGFKSRNPGGGTNLGEYVENNTPSNFVSTSRHANTAATFPTYAREGYVYEIRGAPGGIDVNERMGGMNPNAHEAEIAFEGEIPWEYVTRVWKKDEWGDIDFDYDEPIWER
ncbi:ricin-type beta-trefoil lectin domain protein [Streptomyces sp. NBC_00687]|uniref:scabin-related ADP-ribosyltransferase n=1 Tax=Streptomyces sp. NBC_00687 TaxID=2975807 RepID=UPI00225096BA|nr:ricin-type beta-trefoil lectin domain protein [Streptomyces sp. NBC_00687]MCX4912058.1 ricin-type beta-trefoil lectin domain protein [Streptomyces sp. NBC_00687]